MAIKYLKKAIKTPSTDDHKTREIVQNILNDIEKRREEGIKEVTKKFDSYEGEIIVSKEKIEEASKKVDQKTKDDIHFSYERVRKFAEHQLQSMNNNFEIELSDGLFAGQKLIPVDTAGCYIPGGRYAHISSAVMAITPAKVAGVRTFICASPPKDENGANPGIIYAANLCGANVILNLGGIAAIASMTYGCFDNPPVDFLVGAGNQYVAEAKRIVYGKVGIDQFAGPTEIAIIADKSADKEIVAVDIVGQAEHGYNSPGWLFTTDKSIAEYTIKRVVVPTYQAVSGAGKAAMDELFDQTKNFLDKKNIVSKNFTKQIAFNLIPHIDVFDKDGYTKEELKMINETKKILDENINVTATCVRVPVRTGHSESINIEFEKSYDLENITRILNNAPGCKVIDGRKDGGYITPLEAENDYTTYISRIRKDNSNVKAINIWVVSDNLLKGAALNTVQIAECLMKKFKAIL